MIHAITRSYFLCCIYLLGVCHVSYVERVYNIVYKLYSLLHPLHDVSQQWSFRYGNISTIPKKLYRRLYKASKLKILKKLRKIQAYYRYNRVVNFFMPRRRIVHNYLIEATRSKNLPTSFNSYLSIFCYGRRWYYFFVINSHIVYFCSSGLELMTTLILKKFLSSETRRKNLSYKLISQRVRGELHKYNKNYKAVKHSRSSHILQFNRGVALARFLHFFPARVYLYGNITQLSFFCQLLRRAKLLLPTAVVYYYPWFVAGARKISTEAAIKRAYRRKMLPSRNLIELCILWVWFWLCVNACKKSEHMLVDGNHLLMNSANWREYPHEVQSKDNCKTLIDCISAGRVIYDMKVLITRSHLLVEGWPHKFCKKFAIGSSGEYWSLSTRLNWLFAVLYKEWVSLSYLHAYI